MSSPQTVPTITVYDYLYDDAGVALSGQPVSVTLQYNQAVNLSPQVFISPYKKGTTTDSNGYWQLSLVPNPAMTPNGTVYSVKTPFITYEISIPSSGGPYQSSSILVNQPSIVTPATSTVGALTATGLLTADAGLTVVGTVTIPTAALAESNTANLVSDLAARVTLTGAQTISGTKTFSVVQDFTAGEVVTGGITTDTLTSSGLITASAALTATGLITANGGIVDFTAYKARMYLSTAPTYTYNATTQIPFNQKTYDPNSNASTSTHNWTCPLAGYYEIKVCAAVSTSSSETLAVIILIYKNGSELFRNQVAAGTLAGGSNLGAEASDIQLLAQGDVIDGRIFQVNSASANLSGPTGSNQTYLTVHYRSS